MSNLAKRPWRWAANQDEVLWALAQQFHYPYANQAVLG